jgi:hypothetical protein
VPLTGDASALLSEISSPHLSLLSWAALLWRGDPYRKFWAHGLASKTINAITLQCWKRFSIRTGSVPFKNVNRAHFDARTVTHAQIKVYCNFCAIDPITTRSFLPDLQILVFCGGPVALEVWVNGHGSYMTEGKSSKFKDKPTEVAEPNQNRVACYRVWSMSAVLSDKICKPGRSIQEEITSNFFGTGFFGL